MSAFLLRYGASTPRAFYTTNFPLTENPISESSRWYRTDTNSTAIRTSGAVAFGTQTGSGGFDDSQAALTGFSGLNVSIEITVFRSASISATNHELECCGRNVETSSTTKKYECLFNKDGGTQFVKWTGPRSFSDFKVLDPTSGPGALPGSPQTGDKLRLTIITLSLTQVELIAYYTPTGSSEQFIARTIDDGSLGGPAYLSGDPGIGTYITDTGGNPAHFCASRFTVTSM